MLRMLLSLMLFSGSFTVVQAEEKWISLFNGKDLEGWTPKFRGHAFGENFNNTFRVQDGKLVVAYDQYQDFNTTFGHLFYKTPYSNYRIRLEYRFVGEQCKGGPGWAIRNSGIMVHGQDPKTMTKDQEFPVSVEVQLLGGNGKNERHTGNVCTPGTNIVMKDKLITRHCNDSTSKTYHGDQWVKAEVEVNGHGKIRHFINGELVMEYEKVQYDPNDKDAKRLIANGMLELSAGTISLQAESHPVEFRNIELLDLTPEKK